MTFRDRLEELFDEEDRLNAEILRLKEENAHLAWRNADKNKLIAELCDALSEPRFNELLQRAPGGDTMSGMVADVYEHGICSICGGFYSVCKGQHQCQECGRKDAIIAAQKIHCEGQSAEIERLKKVISLDAVAIGNKNRIITELCDALEQQSCWSTKMELIQRAREATR
jgi:regulator of replication initiation timing